jgi:hypothetical protein
MKPLRDEMTMDQFFLHQRFVQIYMHAILICQKDLQKQTLQIPVLRLHFLPGIVISIRCYFSLIIVATWIDFFKKYCKLRILAYVCF